MADDKIEKSSEQWRAELDDMQYAVTREGATERAFTGKYWNTKTPGTYKCVCCGEALFASDTKYDSGSGWPSFTAPVADGAVETESDDSLGMRRTEVVCHACNAHLGHVFPDGPRECGGLRYCINSAALELEPAGDGGDPDGE